MILDFFISSANAADMAVPSPAAQPSGLPLTLILIGFMVFMYFTVWRPQSRRAKEQRDLISSLAKGDEVMTAGGILGKISKVTDTYVTLTVAENTEITIQKSSIVSALPKGTIKSIQ
jgi:preprotein translocase subunit YajC